MVVTILFNDFVGALVLSILIVGAMGGWIGGTIRLLVGDIVGCLVGDSYETVISDGAGDGDT